MLNEAQYPISDYLSKAMYKTGELWKIEPITKYNLSFSISFIQPDTWRETQVREKAIGSTIVGSIFLIFILLTILMSTIKNYWKGRTIEISKSITTKSKDQKNYRSTQPLTHEVETDEESFTPHFTSLNFSSSIADEDTVFDDNKASMTSSCQFGKHSFSTNLP